MTIRWIYEKRWGESLGQKESCLNLTEQKTIAEFFYYHYCRLILKKIYERQDKCQTLKINEIGCGRGTTSIYLGQKIKNANLFLSDFSLQATKIARKNCLDKKIRSSVCVADAKSICFCSKSFDVQISIGVLEHFPDLNKIFNESYRVLKPNGLMIGLVVPDKKSIQDHFIKCNKFLQKILFFKSKPWLDKTTYSKTDKVFRSKITAEEMAVILNKNGFSNVDFVHVNPFPSIGPLPERVENVLVIFFKIVLFVRKLFFRREQFHCASNISRAFLIYATK